MGKCDVCHAAEPEDEWDEEAECLWVCWNCGMCDECHNGRDCDDHDEEGDG